MDDNKKENENTCWLL